MDTSLGTTEKGNNMTKIELIKKIHSIIDTPGEDMTDGECLDEIISLILAETPQDVCPTCGN